jgi:hypothetical protein
LKTTYVSKPLPTTPDTSKEPAWHREFPSRHKKLKSPGKGDTSTALENKVWEQRVQPRMRQKSNLHHHALTTMAFHNRKEKLLRQQNTPCINSGKGDTLAQSAVSLPHQKPLSWLDTKHLFVWLLVSSDLLTDLSALCI